MDGSSDVQPTETEESPPQSNLQDSQHGPAPSTSEGGLLKALDESAQEKPAPRPDQVANAVSFLTNPKLVVRAHVLLQLIDNAARL